MTVLLGQISVEKVRKFPSMLCERALDSDKPATLVFDLVGTIKNFDDDVVCFFIYLLVVVFCVESGRCLGYDNVEGTDEGE